VSPVAAGLHWPLGSNPSIAIVVPLFNERKALPATIARMSATGADELVFVDGGSTDNSHSLLKESAVQWITSEAGRAVQMNAGAAVCQSDVLLFVHADTVIDGSHLQAVRKAMESDSFVGGRFDVALSGDHPAFRMIAWFMNTRSRLSRISTGDQCQFVRRSLFESMGGFPALPLMEDIALSKSLKREGRIACLREQVMTSSRRWEQNGILKTVLLMWKLRLLYWLGKPASELAAMYRSTAR